jgi:hypothetical protein
LARIGPVVAGSRRALGDASSNLLFGDRSNPVPAGDCHPHLNHCPTKRGPYPAPKWDCPPADNQCAARVADPLEKPFPLKGYNPLKTRSNTSEAIDWTSDPSVRIQAKDFQDADFAGSYLARGRARLWRANVDCGRHILGIARRNLSRYPAGERHSASTTRGIGRHLAR